MKGIRPRSALNETEDHVGPWSAPASRLPFCTTSCVLRSAMHRQRQCPDVRRTSAERCADGGFAVGTELHRCFRFKVEPAVAAR